MSRAELKRELRAVKEAIAILDHQQKIGYTTQIEMDKERYKNQFDEYKYFVDTNKDQLEEHKQRLERDIRESEHGWLGYWKTEDDFIAER